MRSLLERARRTVTEAVDLKWLEGINDMQNYNAGRGVSVSMKNLKKMVQAWKADLIVVKVNLTSKGYAALKKR
jgi:hypothetical protein